MILCISSFIIALVEPKDNDHSRCCSAMASIAAPLITTWPCITEAMHLVSQGSGQESVREMIEAGFLTFALLSDDDAKQSCHLMRKYSDCPMDFADASLVLAAENLGTAKILTADKHFYA